MYETSSLYRHLLLDHTKEEVDIIFEEELRKRNITDYDDFVNNFEKEYNEETIIKDVDFVSYFQLDVQNDFSQYLFDNYISECKYLDLICNFHCIRNVIEEICKNKNTLTNEQLFYISYYVDIIELNLRDNHYITNKGLKNCINLQKLNAYDSKITTCKPFENSLIELNVSDSKNIGDNELKNCVNLQILKARNNRKITTCSPFAISLISLDAYTFCGIDDKGLKNCINLQKLFANSNGKITTCEPFANSLIVLGASNSCGIGDKGLKNCINLQILYATGNSKITTCQPFENSLIELYANSWIYHFYSYINMECGINDKGIQNCTKLKKLYAFNNSNITIKIE